MAFSHAHMPSENTNVTGAIKTTKAVVPVDRRVVRTRAALKVALIELIEERGLEGFNASDLCARADINRGTFYNHYKDKEDLLFQLEDEVMTGIEQCQSGIGSANISLFFLHSAFKKPASFLVELFDYLRGEGDFLHAVLGPGGDHAFSLRLRDSVCENIVQGILHEKYRDDPDPFVGYYVAFFASAYLGLITRWIDTGMNESDEEMALISQRMLFIKPGEAIQL